MNTTELLHKVKFVGPLTRREIDSVRTELLSNESNVDPYSLINILGHCPPTSANMGAIESFLDHPDPMVVGIAVSVLLVRWDCDERFIPKICTFINGVDWDEDQDLRIRTISSSGEWLRGKRSDILVETLLNNYIRINEEPFYRGVIDRALRRAIGTDHTELTSNNLLDTYDASLVQAVKSHFFSDPNRK